MEHNTSPHTRGAQPDIELPDELDGIDLSDILGDGPDGDQDTPGHLSPGDLQTRAACEALDAFGLPDAALGGIVEGIMQATRGDVGGTAYVEAAALAERTHRAVLDAGYSLAQAERAYRAVLDCRAPFDTETFRKKLGNVAALIAMAHRARRHSGRRRIATPRTPAPAVRRTPKRGRTARLATNTRTSGSRRTATATSGGGGSGDDPDPSDPPPSRSVPDDSDPLATERRCAGCNRPLEAGRRSDSKYCPPPRKSACRRLAAKGGTKTVWEDSDALRALRASSRKRLKSDPQKPLDGASFTTSPPPKELAADALKAAARCWDGTEHPEDFDRLTRKVKTALRAGDKPAAESLLRDWFARIDHDREAGIVSCRSCGYLVSTPKAGLPGLTALFGKRTDTAFEMTTDAEGQRLDYRAPKRAWAAADHRRAAGSRPQHEWALLDGEMAA